MKFEKSDGSIYSASRSENISQSENSRFDFLLLISCCPVSFFSCIIHLYHIHITLKFNFFYSASLSTSDTDEALVEEQEPSSSGIPNEFCLQNISDIIYQRACPWAKRQYQPTFAR